MCEGGEIKDARIIRLSLAEEEAGWKKIHYKVGKLLQDKQVFAKRKIRWLIPIREMGPVLPLCHFCPGWRRERQ